MAVCSSPVAVFSPVFSFLFCVIENYSNYACVIPLKDKKGITITNTIHIILNELKLKPNKIWVDIL